MNLMYRILIEIFNNINIDFLGFIYLYFVHPKLYNFTRRKSIFIILIDLSFQTKFEINFIR